MYSPPIRSAWLLLTLCFCAPLASAAASEGIRITAVTEGDRPLAEVEVTVEGRDGTVARFRTDQAGEALAEGLRPGLYRVQAATSGYIGVEEPAVRVVRGKTVPVEFVLRENRGETIEEVVVVAEAPRRDGFGYGEVGT